LTGPTSIFFNLKSPEKMIRFVAKLSAESPTKREKLAMANTTIFIFQLG